MRRGRRHREDYLSSELGNERSARLMTAALDICLLAFILEKERYGYELISGLEAEGIRFVKEGSIYPLLRKMEKDGLIAARLAPSQDGPARKYYKMLPKGKEKLLAWSESFLEFTGKVSGILEKRLNIEDARSESAGETDRNLA